MHFLLWCWPHQAFCPLTSAIPGFEPRSSRLFADCQASSQPGEPTGISPLATRVTSARVSGFCYNSFEKILCVLDNHSYAKNLYNAFQKTIFFTVQFGSVEFSLSTCIRLYKHICSQPNWKACRQLWHGWNPTFLIILKLRRCNRKINVVSETKLCVINYNQPLNIPIFTNEKMAPRKSHVDMTSVISHTLCSGLSATDVAKAICYSKENALNEGRRRTVTH
jgi:hypothetical protein